MNLDDRLRRSAEEINRGLTRIRPPERHRSSPMLRVAVAATAIVLVAGGVLLMLRPGADDTAAPTSSSITDTSTTLPVTTTTETVATAPSTTTSSSLPPGVSTTVIEPPVSLPEPIDGWQRVFVDDGTFGEVIVTDSVAAAGLLVVTGCTPPDRDPGGFPVWFAAGPTVWTRASGPGGVDCLDNVVATPYGLYAGGPDLVRSIDGGATWTRVDLPDAGYIQALLPIEDRLTVLHQRASLNESTIATLYTTVDGVIWGKGPEESAALFDSSAIDDVVAGGPGLVAVGASPAGEFVPTAAAWTSTNGLDWTRVTPDGPGFDAAFMNAVAAVGDGYVAVGGDWDPTRLMASWTSPDGATWTRSPDPAGDVAAQHGFMQAEELAVVAGTLYAVGFDFDAGRPEGEESHAAAWVSRDGVSWRRADADDFEQRVPFAVSWPGDAPVGFWPTGNPRFTDHAVAAPVQVFTGTPVPCAPDADEQTGFDLDGDGDLDTVYLRRDANTVLLGVCGAGIEGEVEVGGQNTTIAGTFDVNRDGLDEVFVFDTAAWGQIHQAVTIVAGAPALTDLEIRFGAIGDQPDGEWTGWAFRCNDQTGELTSTTYEPSGARQSIVGSVVDLDGTSATWAETFRMESDRDEAYSAWGEQDFCGWTSSE